jgi:hypothetical protein
VCCKSKKDTTKASWYLKNSYLLPGTNENLIVQVERRWELVCSTLPTTRFLEFMKKWAALISLFCPEASMIQPIQVKENGSHDPPVINPLLQILWMDSGDGGATGAVAVAMSARTKQGKKALGGLETLKVSNNFGPAGHCNPPRAAKVDGGVREPEFAGRSPSPHKKASGKEASFLFCLDRKKASAAAKGGHNVEAEAIAKDNTMTRGRASSSAPTARRHSPPPRAGLMSRLRLLPRTTWTTTRARASGVPVARQGPSRVAVALWS